MQQTKEQLEAWSANNNQDDDDDVDNYVDDDDDDDVDDGDNYVYDGDDDDDEVDDALQPRGKAPPGDGLERQILGSKSWSVSIKSMNTLQHL